MLTTWLALISATGYGTSDFLVGLAARRANAIRANLLVYSTGTFVVTILACLRWTHSAPEPAPIAWGALSGCGLGAGAMLLTAGFRRSPFSIAAPLSAVIGAAGAAVAGVALGNRPGGYTWAGIIVALPAIAAVSASSAPRGARRPGRLTGAGLGVAAGVGCAVSYIGLGQVSAAAGLWPVLAVQVGALITTVFVAAVTGDLAFPSAGERLSISSGAIGATAAIFYLAAVHAGMLAVAAVVTSLFPVVTIGLARIFEDERLGFGRLAGLVLSVAAVCLIAAGGLRG
jgi:drug/metabolite transporter (DMT)-like permease